MEENKNNKKKILILGILLVIVTIGVLGITYAAYNFQREGDNNELVTGDIYMHYKGQNAGISIDNAAPSKTYDPKEYFEFTIDGKNTYTENDIWYEIDLVEGDEPDGRTTRIDDKYLRFTLTKKIGSGQERTVVNSVGYDDITNKKIWVNKIDKNTNEEITITYKLYMWISDEVHIGYDDENEIQSDYTPDEWNNDVFASVKVNVKGDFIEKEKDDGQYSSLPIMIDIIKEKAYNNTKEIVAINKSGDKCESLESCADNIREYRYTGGEVNNYIYLKDNNNSNELWRIIGVFKDDEAGEYIKIVRNAILPTEKWPEYYTAFGQKYKIKNNSTGYSAYWNRLEPSTSNEKNNWPDAGLQYWLNAEEKDTEGNNNYLSYLSSEVKQRLVSVKYYLGTVSFDKRYEGRDDTLTDNTKEAYTNERAVTCSEDKGTIESSIGFTLGNACRVWKDNATTWNDGLVSLMYPSDYGYAADSKYWDTKPLGNSSYTNGKGGYNEDEVKTSNWMMSTLEETSSKSSWFLSPSSNGSYCTVYLTGAGYVYGLSSVYNGSAGVRPVLNLSSSTTWLDGDGTKNNPYKIIAD